MTAQFFEGPEKKVEWVVDENHPSLRSFGDARWEQVVRTLQGRIISKISGEACDAYLLSESTLLVYDEQVVMITCGQTRLLDGVEAALEFIAPEAIRFLVLERKNEHFPREQPTDFAADARRLNQVLPGRALRFGTMHSHGIEIFHTTRPFEPDSDDTTLEILMHGIVDQAEPFMRGDRPDALARARGAGLADVLEGFEIDDHIFSPAGYSLNALRGYHYFTFHVTPEEVGSYVSFETNVDHRDDPGLVRRVVDLFRPKAFDVLAFAPDSDPLEVCVPDYQLHQHVTGEACGYGISFLHFCSPSVGPGRPIHISLGGCAT